MIGREGLAELLVNNAQGKTSLVAAGGGGGCGGGCGGCGCVDVGGGYRLHRNNQFDCLIAGLSFWWWW